MESKLEQAVQELKANGTDEQYEDLIKNMFESLDRKGKRKVISKSAKFSNQVKHQLFKRS